MEKTENISNSDIDKKMNLFSISIHLCTILLILIMGYLFQMELEKILQIIGFTELILIGILYDMRKNYRDLVCSSRTKYIIIISFLSSLLFLLFAYRYPVFNFWMLSGMSLALLVNVNIGILCNLAFNLLLIVIGGYSMDMVVFGGLLGTILCYFINTMREKKKIQYGVSILFSSNIALMLIIHKFVVDDTVAEELTLSLISTLFLLIAAFIIIRFAAEAQDVNLSFNGEYSEINADNEEEGYRTAVGFMTEESSAGNYLSMEEILTEEFYLLKEMEEYSDKLYEHAVKISSLSYRAALRIHKNEALAKAGGLYYRVGQLRTGNYVENGISIAYECGMPPEIIRIIREHNTKYGTPSTPEAAIIMFSDSIIGMMEYADTIENRKPIAKNKLIDNVFNLRLTTGKLDDTGLSIAELRQLKDFYIEELCCEESF